MTNSEEALKYIHDFLEKGQSTGNSDQFKGIQAFLRNVLEKNYQISQSNSNGDTTLAITLENKDLLNFERAYTIFEDQRLYSQGFFTDGNAIHPMFELEEVEEGNEDEDEGNEDVEEGNEDVDEDFDLDKKRENEFNKIYRTIDNSDIDWTATIKYLTPLQYAILCYAFYHEGNFGDFYARKVQELITPGNLYQPKKAKVFITRCLGKFVRNKDAYDGIPFLINFASQMDMIIPEVFNEIYGGETICGFRSILQQFLVRPELRMQAPIIYQYLLHSGNFQKVDFYKPILEYYKTLEEEEGEKDFDSLPEEIQRYINGFRFLPVKEGNESIWNDQISVKYYEILSRTLLSHNIFISKLEKYLTQQPDEMSATTEDISSFKIDVDTLDRYLLFALSPHSDAKGQLHDIAEAEKQFISYISSMKFYYINHNNKDWTCFSDGFCPIVPTMSISSAFRKKIGNLDSLEKDQSIHIRQQILETGLATTMQSSLEYIMMKLMTRDIDTNQSIYEAYTSCQNDDTKVVDPISLEEKECIESLSKMLDIKVGNLPDFMYEVSNCDKNIFQIRRYNCNVMKFKELTDSLEVTIFSNEFMQINHDINHAYRIVKQCNNVIENKGDLRGVDNDIKDKYFAECNGDNMLNLYRAKEAFSYFIWYTL